MSATVPASVPQLDFEKIEQPKTTIHQECGREVECNFYCKERDIVYGICGCGKQVYCSGCDVPKTD